MKTVAFILALAGLFIPAVMQGKHAAAPPRLYDCDTLVVGVAGSGMSLSPSTAGITVQVTFGPGTWATVTEDGAGKLTITVTETNNTTAERTGYIYIEYGSVHETIVCIQPGKTCERGTEGTEGRGFWMAFSENIELNSLTLDLIATSDRNTSCTVTNPQTGWTQSFTIPANTIVRFPVPREQAYNTDGEQVAAKALYVQSSEKISLYGNNYEHQSSDAANILPVEALGDEYYSLSYNANVRNGPNVATPEEFLIIATEDGTLVTVVPASETGGGKKAGEPYTIRLDKGESYLVKSSLDDPTVIGSYYASITGSYIKANKLIAVFAGHKRARIDCPGSNSRDHLYEQLFPLRLWGVDYIVPSTGQKEDLYRIVAAYDNTQYTINGYPQPPLQRGEYADHTVLQGTCDVIISGQPVEIALFTKSMECLSGAAEGDPFMIALNPAENQIREITYSPIPSSIISHHYTSILTRRTEKHLTILTNMSTGQPVPLTFVDIPGSDYSCARVEVDAVSHHLENSDGFLAYAYGYGDAESYGYSVGAKFNHIPYPPVPDTAYCLHEPPKPLADYDVNNNFWWYDAPDDPNGSPTPPPVNTHTAGTYIFYASQIIDCSESPRKKITIIVHPLPATPVITLSGAATFCDGGSVTLDAATPGAVTYEWYKDGAPAGSASSYVATESGTYAVKITDANGCSATTGSPQTVTEHPLPPTPVITPLPAATFCNGESVTLDATTPTAVTYEWYRNGLPAGSAGSAGTFSVTGSGTYTVTVINTHGCTATSGPQTVTAYPPSAPGITPSGATAFCDGESVTLQADAPTAVAYEWFHNGQAQPAGSASTFAATVGGAYTVKITDANGCTATSSPQSVTVYPLPAAPGITPSGATAFCDGGAVTLQADAPTAVTYEWYKDGAPAGSASSLTATVSGTYTVKVTDANGCTATSGPQTVTAYPLPAAPVITPLPAATFCVGESVTLQADVLTATDYKWYKDGQVQPAGSASTFAATAGGAYFVTITDAHGCTATSNVQTVTAYPPSAPGIAPLGVTEFCAGGAVTLQADAPTAEIYEWFHNGQAQPAGSASTFAATVDGAYTVKITDANGCTATSGPQTVTVYPLPAAPVIMPSGATAFCDGGAVTLHADAPTAVAYEWYKDGAPAGSASSLTATVSGTYTVKVTDANGCTATSGPQTVTVYPLPATPGITPSGATAFCDGESVTLQADAPTAVAYEWFHNGQAQPAGSASTFAATVGGAYTVKITDANGCTATSGPQTVTVYPLPATPGITPSGATAFCDGGAVTLQADAPTAVTYEWYKDGAPAGSASSLTATVSGTYTVKITDANGCTATSGPQTVTVYPLPAAPVITPLPAATFCVGESVTLQADVLTATDYKWYKDGQVQPAGSASTFAATAGGAYFVTITDAHGCTATSNVQTVTAYPPSAPGIAPLGVTEFCAGGAVTLQADAPTAEIYEWFHNGQAQPAGSASTFAATVDGAYTVKITDANGCTATSGPQTVTIYPLPAAPGIAPSGATAFCDGGAVTLQADAPTAVAYEWYKDGAPAGSASSLTATVSGTYTVKVTDANGCTATSGPQTVTVYPLPATPGITPSGATAFCDGESVTLQADAPTAVAYEWFHNGQAQPAGSASTFAATVGGAYTVKITDANGCTATSNPQTVTVYPLPATPGITPAGATAFCDGGAVMLNITDLLPIATYEWFHNNVTTSVISISYAATATGTYTVKVTDANGCTATSGPQTVTVYPLPAAPGITPSGATAFCDGESVILQADAPTAVAYEWFHNGQPVGAAHNFIAAVSGVYTVKITDANGCTATSGPQTVTVHSLPGVVIVPSGATAFCDGGSVTLQANAPTSVTYEWYQNGQPAGSASSVVAVTSSTYVVKVTDVNGCTATSGPQTVTVYPLPAAPGITPSGATTFCDGESVILQATNIPTAIAYEWYKDGQPAGYASSLTATASGTYTVKIIDGNDCTATSGPQTVTVHPLPATPGIAPSGATSFCDGGSVTLHADAPTAVAYEWYKDGQPVGNSNNFVAAVSGAYTIKITDGNGCTATSSPQFVTVYSLPNAVIVPSDVTAFCDGGSVTLQANAPTSVTYEWYQNGQPAGSTSSVVAVTSSTYVVKVTDVNGCTATSGPQTVMVYPLPATPGITPSGATAFCDGESVILQADAPTAVAYEWYQNGQPVGAAHNFIAAISGVYTVKITDANGCTATSGPQTVTVHSLPGVVIVPSGATAFCDSGAVTLQANASTAVAYEWYQNGQPAGSASSLTATVSGAYTVKITDANGCTATSGPQTVTVYPLPAAPVITPSGATAFCDGESVILQADAPTAVAYEWFLNGQPAGYASSLTATVSGTYTVKIIDGNDCTATSSPQTVTVLPLPATPGIAPSGATSFCDGGSVTLHADAPTAVAYEWYKDGQPVGNSNNFVAAVSGAYTIKITDGNGCTATSSPQFVTVYSLPNAVIVPSDVTAFCDGGSVTLQANAPTSVTYEWYQNGQPAGSASSVVAVTSSTYVVKVIDVNGCTATSGPQTVTVYPLPAAPGITPSGATTFCGGGSVTLTAYAADAIRYEWYKDNQALANVWSNTCTVSETGNYSVVSLSRNGCRSLQMSETVQVTVYALPGTPVIIAQPPFYIDSKHVLKIQAPEENVRYEWYKDRQYTGYNGEQYLLPALRLGDMQVYFVEAVNEHDCRSRSAVLICVAEIPPLFIPNVFTPNGDGVNDRFHIAGLEAYMENELQIINKRGQVVYAKKDYDNQWDGDGLATDTYYYYLILTDKQGNISRHRGYVHLKR